jgi:hypothetical protein
VSTQRFELARSLWPRTGGDRGHRGRLHARGPRYERMRTIALPRAEGAWRGGGLAIDEAGALVVAHAGFVSWLDVSGCVLARCEPPAERADEPDEGHPAEGEDHTPVHVIGAPLALADGGVVVTTRDEVLVLDRGAVRDRWPIEGLDDSDVSPNVTHGGALVLGSMFGTVTSIEAGGPRELGAFGYDVVAPAITREDVLVVAGYAKAGLCAVGMDGTRRWTSSLRAADLVPTLDDDDHAACGSLNENASLIVSTRGEVLARLDRAARFASLPGGDWLARSDRSLARLERDGTERWSVALASGGPHWSSELVVTLEDGRVHVRDGARVAALDLETGARLASLALPGEEGRTLGVAGRGLLATREGDELVVIE